MKANAMLMMLLMLTAALSGCAGDESEEWIDQLEQEATNHEGVMESLNRTLPSDSG